MSKGPVPGWDRDEGRHYAPWERAFSRVVSPFEEFIKGQTSSGLALAFTTVVALVLANSPLAEAYHHLIHTPIAVQVGAWGLEKSLLHWVNDGLMALFFFLAGLEIKREALVGELASPRRALLPILAAVGGMVVPAGIYAFLNLGGVGLRGWGIPMATDIAFVVGVLVLLGDRVPRSLMAFMVALAIVDDLGAVLVIALFYTAELSVTALAVAGALLALLVLFNRGGVRSPLPYFLVGGLVWLAFLKSGVHATVAGVLVAFTIPARPRYQPPRFSRAVRSALDEFDAVHRPGEDVLRNQRQFSLLQALETGIHGVQTPLQRLEHAFQIPVGVLVMPVFALVNAGIGISLTQLGALLSHPIALGTGLGLIVGKFIGITGSVFLAVRLGLAQLPTGAGARHMVAAGLLGGIGFTMSIFIADLAFAGMARELLMAKTGIILASAVAGLGAALLLAWPARGAD